MKIAFMGISGSGKDFLASYLIHNHGFTRLSFSDQLKRLATCIYPWMEKDYPPEEKMLPLNISLPTGETIGYSPRDIWLSLNKLRCIEEKIFIRMLSEELKNIESNSTTNEKRIIITDIRSNEELIWCKNNQFIVIYIERGGNDYAKYDIDNHVIENKKKADYHFHNDSIGIDSFKLFVQGELINE